MDESALPAEEVRRLGRLAADAVADHRAGLGARPVFGKVGPQAGLFDEPLPEDGRPLEELLAFVREHVLTRPFGNSPPRLSAVLHATAAPLGPVADLPPTATHPPPWG